MLVNKFAEIKIAKYESKNVVMLLEETKADLANLQRQKADLDNALEARKQQLEIALKDLEGIKNEMYWQKTELKEKVQNLMDQVSQQQIALGRAIRDAEENKLISINVK